MRLINIAETSVIDTARSIRPPPRPPKPTKSIPTHPFSEAITGIPEGEEIPLELYEKIVDKYISPVKKKLGIF